jgi:hypothetical protein
VTYRPCAIGESATNGTGAGMDSVRRLQLHEVEISRACSRRAGWLKSPSEKWRTSAHLLEHNDPVGPTTRPGWFVTFIWKLPTRPGVDGRGHHQDEEIIGM